MKKLLDDMLSRDPHRVWSAAGAVIRLRDSAALDVLAVHSDDMRRATGTLALGGAVFPNAEHLRFALRKLEFHRDRQGCLCALYPEYLMYSPHREEQDGHVRIDAVTTPQDAWGADLACTCRHCGSRFHVQERESHYTWWGWKALAAADQSSASSQKMA